MRSRHCSDRFAGCGRSFVPLLLALTAIGAAAGGVPPTSLSRDGLMPLEGVELHTMAPVNLAELAIEDEANDAAGVPYRVGYPMASDLSPSNSGTWEELPGGGRLWRLRVRSAGALWIALGCS